MEKGVRLAWQLWTEKSVFYCEKGLFWAEKSVFYCKKGGHFQTGEQGWVPLFPVSEAAGSNCDSYIHNIINALSLENWTNNTAFCTACIEIIGL